nr:hypothetical protein [Tanacetum cinerariifolium]
MDTCTALSKIVEHLELDKIAQAPEITKLKRRVKKLERTNKVKVLKLIRLQKVKTTQRVETFDDTMMDDVSNQGRMIVEMDQDVDVVLEEAEEVADDAKADQDTKVDESVDIQGRKVEYQAEIYKIDLEHANKVLSMQEDESEPAKVQEVVDVVTTAKIITEVVTAANKTFIAASTTIIAAEAQVPAAKLTAAPARVTATPSRRRKGVVIRDPQEESTTSTIIPTKTKSKDKVPSKDDLDNLFGPLYDEYYATRTPIMSNDFIANTLDNEDTPSSSLIFVEEDEAPQIVSSSEEPIANEATTSVSIENSNEQV